MGTKQRRERERQEIRHSILSAAQAIAAEEGWQAVTTRKVAERIEYRQPTIYEYFENKDLLLSVKMTKTTVIKKLIHCCPVAYPQWLAANLAGKPTIYHIQKRTSANNPPILTEFDASGKTIDALGERNETASKRPPYNCRCRQQC